MHKNEHSTEYQHTLRRLILESATTSGEGHIPSAFSILDILWVLYDQVLNIDPKNPNDDKRDRLIVSKGHASLGIYAVLAEKGFFKTSELLNFAKFNNSLGGHPDRNKVPGIEASTGSLGHGFPMAVGIAMALKIKKNKAKGFVIIGDGESNEGTVWESALLASHHELSNLCCIIDYNHSNDKALKLGNLRKKFESFGWETRTINGHNHKEIYTSLSTLSATRPTAIIAETIKGKGSKTMENNHAWHHKTPNKEELESLLKELA